MQWFRKDKPAPVISREDALSMAPVVTPGVEAEVLENGTIRLTYQVTVRPWFSRMASKVGMWDGEPMTKRLDLDEMGTYVWNLMDGTSSADSISSRFAAHYGVQKKEAELSVSAFLKSLGQRGLIGMAEL